MLDKIVDYIFDIFYSKDKTKLYIVMLFIAAFLLRLTAANNLGMKADDAVHALRPLGIIESGHLEEYGQSSVLWYYIQEVFYKIFGTSQLDSRLATAFFGSFFVILMYLFVVQVFKSKKAGLIAAVLVAFSPVLIKMTLPEMDITVMFFLIFSALFIFKFVENSKMKDLIFSSVFLGIAIMIKIYALFFAVSYFLFLSYIFFKKKEFNKKAIKKLVVFTLIPLLFFTPTLTYNYLLYKDKGFMDLMFTNYFKLGKEKADQLYGWGAGYMAKTDYVGFFLGKQVNWVGDPLYKFPGFLIILIYFIRGDPIITIFGFLGLVLLIKRRNNFYLPFFLLSFIPIFIYIGSQIPMLKHLTFTPVLLVPLASFFIDHMDNKAKVKMPKFRLRYVIMVFIIFNLLWLGIPEGNAMRSSIYTESGASQIIDYKIENIDKNSLVVVDSRVFRGFIAWMFYDRNYIESSLFSQAIQESQKYDGSPVPTEVYFVECAKDDCGWGTIKGQPDFNQSMEQIVQWFANNSKMIKEINETNTENYYFPFLIKYEGNPVYRVYKTQVVLNPAIISMARSTHNIMMYPIGYDESIGPVFDKYETHNSIDALIDKLAHYILYFGLFISMITAIFLIYLFLKEK